MKNDSPLFPYELPDDKMFDKNKDGNLTGNETKMRDAYHMDLMEEQNKSTPYENSNNSYSGSGISTFGAIVITILSMLGAGYIAQALDIESGLLIAILWIVFAVIILIAVIAFQSKE